MKVLNFIVKKNFRNAFVVCLCAVQLLASCRKDERAVPKPMPVDEELKPFKDYKFSKEVLVFPDVVIGRLKSDGTYNKSSTIGWTHPSVKYFEKKWNNHQYWMAITPYPSGVNEYENPTIFCSDDGKSWKEPEGIDNPIEKAPPAPGYNSDVNLLFDNGKLYCFWRGMETVDPVNHKVINGRTLLYKSSVDGVHWSEKKVITTWNYLGIDLIAPAILKESNRYFCYGVCTGETTPGAYYTNYAIRRSEVSSFDDVKVDRDKGYQLVNIATRPWGENEEPWHIEVKKFREKWYMMVSTTYNNQYGNGGRLFFGFSNDGISFTFGAKPICPLTNCYKSSFELYENKKPGVSNIKLWRTSSSPWAVYFDEFSLEGYFDQSPV